MNKHLTNQSKASSVHRHAPDRADRAFTLTELLVVLATLGILSVLLLPAQNVSQSGSSKSFQCLNNLRQMAVAWTLYSEENHDRLPYNYDTLTIQNDLALSTPTYASWVEDIMDWSGGSYVTNTYGIRACPFNSYLSGSIDVYKCPADRYLSGFQLELGWTARPRSYSMNCFFGASNPTWVSGAGNEFYPGYRQFLKTGSIPNPANTYVFLEEHPDSINDGYFDSNADTNLADWNYHWNDLPGSNHAGSGGFSFADGHSEIHKWRSNLCTILPVKYAPIPLRTFNSDPTGAGAQDAEWIASRASVPR